MGLLLWCLVRQGRGVRVPLQGGVTEPAITAAGAIASADAAVSASFARSPPSAAPQAPSPLSPPSPPKPPSLPSASEASLGAGAIAGIVIGVFLVVGIGVAVTVRCASSSSSPAPTTHSLEPSTDAALTHWRSRLSVLGRMMMKARKPVKPTEAGLP